MNLARSRFRDPYFEGELPAGGFQPVPVESPGGGRIKNKKDPQPADVVQVPRAGGGSVPLHRLAAQALEAMVRAARAEGIADPLLLPVSGYRSAATQARLWEAALAKAGGNAQEARKWVAPPGSSAHQSGRAVDLHLGYGISSKNVAAMRQTAVWRWLEQNAVRFGFYPYEAEPWHWEYNPPARSGSVTPVPAPGTAPAAGTRPTLRLGSKGLAVVDLQSRLNVWLGANPGAGLPLLKIDGSFGPKTLKAVLAFQKAMGIQVDGIVGPQTWSALDLALKGPSKPIPSPGPGTPAPTPAGGGIVYPVVPGQEYGSKWRSTRPPGLPATARRASAAGAAVPWIEQLARAQGLGDAFVRTVRHLAETESGARFGLPANIFDARPAGERPSNKPLITAWGAFQFNRDAWRSLPGVASTAFPWDCTPREEIARPIERYARLFRDVVAAGGGPVDAARGIRLWHITPAGFGSYLRTGRGSGFGTAWQQVPADRRQQIDKRLRESGVL
ncbi:MAG: D-alanyl-D-alanine carboxypeptidase family protein [Acidobacteriota bacterium]